MNMLLGGRIWYNIRHFIRSIETLGKLRQETSFSKPVSETFIWLDEERFVELPTWRSA
jgi:hypothetical protein